MQDMESRRDASKKTVQLSSKVCSITGVHERVVDDLFIECQTQRQKAAGRQDTPSLWALLH